MKTSTFLKLTFQTLALIFLPCGCSHNPSISSEQKEEAHELVGIGFKEGKGVELSEQTKKSLGFEIVEVSEEKISSAITIPIQIYREANTNVISNNAKPNRAYGTGVVTLDQAKQIEVGQAVTLELTESGIEKVEGRLIRINKSFQPALGGIEVLVEIPDQQHRFNIGTMFQAHLTGKKSESVTAIPTSALLKTANGKFVYVVNGKHLFRTPVKTGTESGDFIEITDGLYPGDQVARKPVLDIWMAELQAIKGGKACADGH